MAKIQIKIGGFYQVRRKWQHRKQAKKPVQEEIIFSSSASINPRIHFIYDIVKLLYYPYRIRKKLEIIHRLSRSTILYAYV